MRRAWQADAVFHLQSLLSEGLVRARECISDSSQVTLISTGRAGSGRMPLALIPGPGRKRKARRGRIYTPKSPSPMVISACRLPTTTLALSHSLVTVPLWCPEVLLYMLTHLPFTLEDYTHSSKPSSGIHKTFVCLPNEGSNFSFVSTLYFLCILSSMLINSILVSSS